MFYLRLFPFICGKMLLILTAITLKIMGYLIDIAYTQAELSK